MATAIRTYSHTVTVPAATDIVFDGGAATASDAVFTMKRTVTGAIEVTSDTTVKVFNSQEAQEIYSLFRKALQGTAENP